MWYNADIETRGLHVMIWYRTESPKDQEAPVHNPCRICSNTTMTSYVCSEMDGPV